MNKDFDSWNFLKKRLDGRKKLVFCHEKEIWWCSLGLNIGCEENGKNVNFERPILIFKKFNREMLLALPMTSRIKKDKYHYKLCYKDKKSSIILSQIRLISSKRLLRKIGMVSKRDFLKIRIILKRFL